MEIQTFQYNGDRRVVNKQLTTVGTVNGDYKTSLDLMSGTLLWECDTTPYFNYISVDGRYYYVGDYVKLRNNLISANIELDVLMSYQDEIKSQRAVLERSETVFNRYLPDGELRTNAYNRVQTKAFPNSFTGNGTMILVVTGG